MTTHLRRLLSHTPGTARLLGASALLALLLAPAAHADGWARPTKEELEMTSLPGYPGAPAVVLFREEITKDDLHVVQHYERIKILTEEGKKYANVELGYFSTSSTSDWSGDGKTLDQISGRTIHPDGTIIPFTGKPYLKVIEKARGASYQARVFSLPDVQVGSIIEYRYATRYNDGAYEAPDWYIQGDLYLKSAHFAWYPTLRQLVDYKERSINTITWFPILPAGARIVRTELPAGGGNTGSQQTYDLVVKDVPPEVKEEFMPPLSNYSYRVLFNFSSSRSFDDYWKSEGKEWSKKANSFANPNSDLKSATESIIAGATSDDARLRKIYAAVMALENTDFTREHDKREDKANGVGKLKDSADVLNNKRGNSTQITELFVGMARAAGLKAELMLVPDRSKELFTPSWLTFRQFDGVLAIVTVGGKEQFFDPGSRYCAYGHLAWEHTFIDGLRQKDGETQFARTDGDAYMANHTSRIANLTMDEKGQLTGKVDLSFSGSAALHWRHVALRGDEESLKHDLRSALEEMLPKSLEVKTIEVHAVEDYEKPLLVNYTVEGTLGSWTGKRLLLPPDLFLASVKATFPHEKRELPVYFQYPQFVQDALRINFPAALTVEAVPSPAKFDLPQTGAYSMSVAQTPTSITTRRNYAFNNILILPASYAQLRNFYSQFEANDQQSIVLKTAPAASSATTSGGR